MKVAKWGNSLAIRLPAAVVEILDLKVGDEIEILAPGQRSMLVDREADREALLKRLRNYRGVIPADFKFDRSEIYERD